jgi:tetratricopeptide (TPR) repeat protein
LLAAGLAALESSDRHELERLTATLERRGHLDHAHYLRSRAAQARAHHLLQRVTHIAQQEARVQAGHQVLGLAAALTASPSPAALINVPVDALTSAIRPFRRERNDLDIQIAAALQEAHRHAAQVPPESPLRVEAAIVAGECLMKLGDHRAAASAWSFVVEHRPDHADAHRYLVIIFDDLGAMPRVVHHLEALARLEPDDGRAHRQIGFIMKDDKQSRLAIEAYREALRRSLSPAARAEVVKELTEVWLGEGETDYQEALATLQLCPAEFSQRPEILTLHATALWKSHSQEMRAIELVERALQRDPDLVDALLLRAQMWLDVEQPQHALPFLLRAARLAPHQLTVRTRLAQAYERFEHQLARVALMVECSQAWVLALGVPASMPLSLSGFVEGVIGPQTAKHAQFRDEVQKRIERLSELSRLAMERVWDDKIRCEIAKLWVEMENPQLARVWFRAALTCNPQNREARDGMLVLGSSW